jgi:hypothetical protein
MGAQIQSAKVDHASLITEPDVVVAMIHRAINGSAKRANSTQQHG